MSDPKDGHLCCQLYKKLPPRRGYKDYYELIEQPIDLQIIASRARNGGYRTLKEFEADVLLLFDNARLYNMEGSPVYQVKLSVGRGGVLRRGCRGGACVLLVLCGVFCCAL